MAQPPPQVPPSTITPQPKRTGIHLAVNGKPYLHAGDPEMPLLWWLRDYLQLTGTKYACGAVRHWRIVGEDEADAGSGSVSWISPLARALAGARVGDEVLWPRPAGAQPLTVLAIRYPDARTPR